MRERRCARQVLFLLEAAVEEALNDGLEARIDLLELDSGLLEGDLLDLSLGVGVEELLGVGLLNARVLINTTGYNSHEHIN